MVSRNSHNHASPRQSSVRKLSRQGLLEIYAVIQASSHQSPVKESMKFSRRGLLKIHATSTSWPSDLSRNRRTSSGKVLRFNFPRNEPFASNMLYSIPNNMMVATLISSTTSKLSVILSVVHSFYQRQNPVSNLLTDRQRLTSGQTVTLISRTTKQSYPFYKRQNRHLHSIVAHMQPNPATVTNVA